MFISDKKLSGLIESWSSLRVVLLVKVKLLYLYGVIRLYMCQG